MKKFMLGTFILLFVVAVSCVGGAKKAEALIIGTDLTYSTAELAAFTVQSSTHTILFAGSGAEMTVGVYALGLAMTGDVGTEGLWTDAPSFSTPNVFLGSTFTEEDLAGFGLTDLKIVAFNDNDDIWGYDIWIKTVDDGVVSSAVVEVGAGFSTVLTLAISGLDLAHVTGFGVSIHGNLIGGTNDDYPTALDGFHTSYSAVPEPGTIALLGIGLVGLVGVGVRRRAKKNAA